MSVQAQILNLLHELQTTRNLTYVFVSHDLGVIQHISDRLLVMYLGEIVEDGDTSEVLTAPTHPYTKALVDANPALVDSATGTMKGLEGSVPDPAHPPEGCRFHTRCPVVTAHCGWDFSDAVRWITNHDELRHHVQDHTAHTPFAGDIKLADDESAARSLRLLQTMAPAPMQKAMLEATLSGSTLSLRFGDARARAAAGGAPGASVELHLGNRADRSRRSIALPTWRRGTLCPSRACNRLRFWTQSPALPHTTETENSLAQLAGGRPKSVDYRSKRLQRMNEHDGRERDEGPQRGWIGAGRMGAAMAARLAQCRART